MSGISAAISSVCKKLIDQEVALFQDAYRKFYLPGETKPPEIAAPYLLHQPVAKTGVLLIHGFMAAPYEVREWADNLFSEGYTVYAPRLAGHGTSADDLAAQNYTDWAESVERGFKILSECVESVIVAGFSTGAGLALHQAISYPGKYRAVVSVSAPMKFKGLSARLSETVEQWNRAAAFLNLNALQKPFAVNHPDNPEINYRRCPIHGFNQVKALMRKVYQGLPSVDIPTLIIQGNQDPKVSPRAGRIIFQRIGAVKKQCAEIDHPIHGIVRGAVGKRVFAVVNSFLSKLESY